jgi:hypothetical protein
VAIGICQPTFRPPAGLTHRPLAGAPLRWRQVLGWHPDGPAARVAPSLLELAAEAYQESIGRNTRYLAWLADYPRLGGPEQPLTDAGATTTVTL